MVVVRRRDGVFGLVHFWAVLAIASENRRDKVIFPGCVVFAVAVGVISIGTLVLAVRDARRGVLHA